MRDRHFVDHEEPGRAVLDHVDWIRNSVVRARPKIADDLRPTNVGPRVELASVETATALWRGSPQYPSKGNSRFFANPGVSLCDTENRLSSEVDNARTDGLFGKDTRSVAFHHISTRV